MLCFARFCQSGAFGHSSSGFSGYRKVQAKLKEFNAEDISNVSYATGSLREWVIAMELYAKVFRDVEPVFSISKVLHSQDEKFEKCS